MYHIKPDKRSQTSASLLIQAFYECLKAKSFSEITITDLQRESSVGRATFYRLFDTTADILSYECDNLFQKMIEEGEKKENLKNDEAILLFYKYWTQHSRLLEILAKEERVDILYNTFCKYSEEIHTLLIPDVSLTKKEIQYFLSITAYAMVGCLVTWIQQGKKDSYQQLTSIYKETLFTLSASV